MDKLMIELKPCPFCGGVPTASEFKEPYCVNDNCSIRRTMFRNADDWNNRVEQPSKESDNANR